MSHEAARMVLTNKADSAKGAETAQEEAPPVPRGRRPFLSTIWSARGFFGGLAAIGLAALGQWTLLLSNNSDAAFLYYLAAFIVLIASLHRRLLPTHQGRLNPAAAMSSGDPSAGG